MLGRNEAKRSAAAAAAAAQVLLPLSKLKQCLALLGLRAGSALLDKYFISAAVKLNPPHPTAIPILSQQLPQQP